MFEGKIVHPAFRDIVIEKLRQKKKLYVRAVRYTAAEYLRDLRVSSYGRFSRKLLGYERSCTRSVAPNDRAESTKTRIEKLDKIAASWMLLIVCNLP